MDTEDIIWIVVALLVLAALVGLLMAMKKRKDAHRHEQATGLRQEAAAAAPNLRESELEAQEREARAERARLEAERAEREAAEARQSVAAEHAHVEDKVRTADQVDPHVDHTSSDYAPNTTPADQAVSQPPQPTGTTETTPHHPTTGGTATDGTTGTTDPGSTGGRHSV